MIAAYVLAGEFGRIGNQPHEAFDRYEGRLHPFIVDKQKAAVQFAGSFAPKTRFGLFFRNQITRTFRLPLIAKLAKLAMGRSLFDRIDLPDYPVPKNAPL